MTISDLIAAIQGTLAAGDSSQNDTISCGYTCDLLSWVMAKGQKGMAWVTVQNHVNVVAVAVLAEMACVILPERITMESAALSKASEENISIIYSPLSAYDICTIMAKAGVHGPDEL